MRQKKLTLGVLCAALVLWMGTAEANGFKAYRGIVADPQNTDFLAFTTTGGGGGTAAMVLNVDAQIEGIGQAVVNIDASWHWSPGPYTVDHPCALVNQTAQILPDLVSGGAFNYTATVTITSKNGKHVLVGDVSGGSVCEILVFGPASSINQWLIAFEIDPAESAGKFVGAEGQGLIDFKYDSSTFSFVQPFQVFLNLDKK